MNTTDHDARCARRQTNAIGIALLAAAIQALSREAGVIERLDQVGVESTTTTPEQMAAIIRAEQAVCAEAVKAAGLTRPQ